MNLYVFGVKCCLPKAHVITKKFVNKVLGTVGHGALPTKIISIYIVKTETLMLTIKGKNGSPPDELAVKAARDIILESCCGTRN